MKFPHYEKVQGPGCTNWNYQKLSTFLQDMFSFKNCFNTTVTKQWINFTVLIASFKAIVSHFNNAINYLEKCTFLTRWLTDFFISFFPNLCWQNSCEAPQKTMRIYRTSFHLIENDIGQGGPYCLTCVKRTLKFT